MLNMETTIAAILAAARKGNYISYSAIARANGVQWQAVFRAVSPHLDQIIAHCHQKDWPIITAIVVPQSALQTGTLSDQARDSFAQVVRPLGYGQNLTNEQLYRDEQRKTFKWARTQA